jgi:hypothetical protein
LKKIKSWKIILRERKRWWLLKWVAWEKAFAETFREAIKSGSLSTLNLDTTGSMQRK